jgi:hypothetical protein
MSLPQVFSRAEVLSLFGMTRWPFADSELRPIPPEKRRPGKPTEYYSAPAVYSLFRKLFNRLPTPEDIEQALTAVQRRRLTALLSHTTRKLRTLGAQPHGHYSKSAAGPRPSVHPPGTVAACFKIHG